jgi:hypothetical protein
MWFREKCKESCLSLMIKFFSLFAVLNTRKLLTVKISNRHLILIFLLIFGVYGWGTFDGSFNTLSGKDLPVTLSVLITVYSLHISKDRVNSLLPNLGIKWSHLIGFLSILGIAIILNASKLTYPLTGDELFYAYQSQIQSLKIVSLTKDLLPEDYFSFIGKYVYQTISIVILMSGLTFIALLLKVRSDRIFLGLSILFLLIARQFIQTLNSNSHVHSPLPSFWYFLTSTVFGYNTYVYRISSLVPYCLVATFIYFYLTSKVASQKITLVLTLMLFFSVPLLNSMSLILEPANWTLLICITFLIVLIKNKFDISEAQILFLSTALYLRTNLIFFIATVLTVYIYRQIKRRKLDKIIFVYIVVMIPGILVTVLSRVSNRIDAESDIVLSVVANSKNTLHSLSLSHSTLYAALGIITICFLLVNPHSRLFGIMYIFSSAFLFLGLQFPALSVLSKYQAEYLYPLVIILPIILLARQDGHKNYMSIFLIASLLFLNIYGNSMKTEVYKSFREIYKESASIRLFGGEVMPNAPFPYQQIFESVKTRKLSGCLNAGVVYSVFPEILGGYSLREVLVSANVRDEFLTVQSKFSEAWTGISLRSIDEAGIKCVILGLVTEQPLTVANLQENGWRIIDSQQLIETGTTVYLMVRE